MDNLKCLFYHVSAHASVDFIDACETLRKELLKSMKIAKKFKEKLKIIVRMNFIFVVYFPSLNFLNTYIFLKDN